MRRLQRGLRGLTSPATPSTDATAAPASMHMALVPEAPFGKTLKDTSLKDSAKFRSGIKESPTRFRGGFERNRARSRSNSESSKVPRRVRRTATAVGADRSNRQSLCTLRQARVPGCSKRTELPYTDFSALTFAGVAHWSLAKCSHHTPQLIATPVRSAHTTPRSPPSELVWACQPTEMLRYVGRL